MSNFATRLQRDLNRIHATLNVDVDADTTRAEARLRRLTRDRRVRVRVDTVGGVAPIGGGGGLGGIGRGATMALGPAQALGAALAVVGAVNLVPLIAQLSQAAGVLALMPAAAASAGASLATIAIGATGIAGAFSAASKETAGAGAAAATSARQQRDAAKAVEDAIEGVQDAREDAARTAKQGSRQIVAAERDVAEAHKRTLEAQEELTDARRDAQEEIEDLNAALRGTLVDEEDAAIALERAIERRRELGSDGKPVSRLDRREADNDVRQAQLRLDEVRRRNAELAQEAAEANRAGIEGSEQVRDAKEAVAEATLAERDAEDNLKIVREDVARANEEAQERIQDALERVTEAQERQAEALTTAAGGVDAFAEAMAKLSPNAQDFVNKVRSLGSAWSDLRLSVQDNLFEGLGDAVVNLADNYLPMLKTGFSGIATEINGGILSLIRALNEEGAKSNFAAIFENTRIAVGPFMDGLNSLAEALGNVAAVGSEFLPGISQGFKDLMDRFAEWSGSDQGGDWLRNFIADSIAAFKQVADFAVSLGRVIGALFSQTEDQGGSMLQSFTDNLNKLADWMGTAEGRESIRDFFSDMRDTMNSVLEVARLLGGAIGWVSDFLDTIGASDATSALGNDLRDIQEEIQIWQDRWNGFSEWWRNWWGGLEDTVHGWKNSLTQGFADWWNSTTTAVKEELAIWGKAWEDLKTGVSNVWNSITTTVSDAWNGLQGGIGSGIETLKGWFSELGTFVGGIWDGILEVIRGAVHGIGRVVERAGRLIEWAPGNHGERMIEVGQRLQQFRDGGYFRGIGGPRDDKNLVLLSNGEYVVNAAATAQWLPLLDKINNHQISAYANGGGVGFNAEAAIAKAKAHDGEPYVYGGLDCSGYLSEVFNAGTGQSVRFVTGSDFEAMGWVKGYDPNGFSIGTDLGVGENGHMAGSLYGVNIESDGSNGIQYGRTADGPLDFPYQFYWPGASSGDDPSTESWSGADFGTNVQPSFGGSGFTAPGSGASTSAGTGGLSSPAGGSGAASGNAVPVWIVGSNLTGFATNRTVNSEGVPSFSGGTVPTQDSYTAPTGALELDDPYFTAALSAAEGDTFHEKALSLAQSQGKGWTDYLWNYGPSMLTGGLLNEGILGSSAPEIPVPPVQINTGPISTNSWADAQKVITRAVNRASAAAQLKGGR
ncbi:phage tail protein [Rhodococcus rhodochrous]|uniref:phage tail protein n=1 Tax=Rhodococcus rhodochrous TaxID=1829 RepID=UPI0013520FE9|nr:hypothetical protein [Rhodococcus rhodochrous]